MLESFYMFFHITYDALSSEKKKHQASTMIKYVYDDDAIFVG
jgi:hypothetical protein